MTRMASNFARFRRKENRFIFNQSLKHSDSHLIFWIKLYFIKTRICKAHSERRMSEILTNTQEEYPLPQPTTISQEVQAPKISLTLQDFDKESNSNEEEKDDQLNSSFYDDLVLPEPNPLPRKKRGIREPLRLIYDYPYK